MNNFSKVPIFPKLYVDLVFLIVLYELYQSPNSVCSILKILIFMKEVVLIFNLLIFI